MSEALPAPGQFGWAGPLNTVLGHLDTRLTVVEGYRRLLGISDLSVGIVTAGTAVTVWHSVAFDAGSNAVRVSLSGGHFSAASAVAITWDLYDPIDSKVLRQSIRTYPTASAFEPIPALSRTYLFPSGPRVVQFRIKPAANVAITLVNALTSPDESPLQLEAEEVAYA